MVKILIGDGRRTGEMADKVLRKPSKSGGLGLKTQTLPRKPSQVCVFIRLMSCYLPTWFFRD